MYFEDCDDVCWQAYWSRHSQLVRNAPLLPNEIQEQTVLDESMETWPWIWNIPFKCYIVAHIKHAKDKNKNRLEYSRKNPQKTLHRTIVLQGDFCKYIFYSLKCTCLWKTKIQIVSEKNPNSWQFETKTW